MSGLSSAHLRELADRLDSEEEEERRKLENAETSAERAAVRARLGALEARNAELEQQIAAKPASEDEDDDEGEGTDDDGTDDPKPKMRRGRKHGMTYQDRPGEMGYVYQGEDEPDLVQVDDEADAA